MVIPNCVIGVQLYVGFKIFMLCIPTIKTQTSTTLLFSKRIYCIMIWSDKKILKVQSKTKDLILPFAPGNVQPNSYDVTLGESILVETPDGWIKKSIPYSLKKSEFILATTNETVHIPNKVVCELNGKSSIGRSGAIVHFTAGFLDSGFNGKITLEMTNLSMHDFNLVPGMKIGQLVFYDSYKSNKVYGECGNHYQFQDDVTPAYNSKIVGDSE